MSQCQGSSIETFSEQISGLVIAGEAQVKQIETDFINDVSAPSGVPLSRDSEPACSLESWSETETSRALFQMWENLIQNQDDAIN